MANSVGSFVVRLDQGCDEPVGRQTMSRNGWNRVKYQERDMSWTRQQRLAAIAAAHDVWAAKWAEHFTPAKDGGTDGAVSQYPEGGLDVDSHHRTQRRSWFSRCQVGTRRLQFLQHGTSCRVLS